MNVSELDGNIWFLIGFFCKLFGSGWCAFNNQIWCCLIHELLNRYFDCRWILWVGKFILSLILRNSRSEILICGIWWFCVDFEFSKALLQLGCFAALIDDPNSAFFFCDLFWRTGLLLLDTIICSEHCCVYSIWPRTDWHSPRKLPLSLLSWSWSLPI